MTVYPWYVVEKDKCLSFIWVIYTKPYTYTHILYTRAYICRIKNGTLVNFISIYST